jgi:hypothetical protein
MSRSFLSSEGRTRLSPIGAPNRTESFSRSDRAMPLLTCPPATTWTCSSIEPSSRGAFAGL